MAQGKISAKQKEILDYIKSQIMTKGYPPSVRDICQAVHLKSTSSVHSHLETLERNGFIRRDPTKPRAIEILDNAFNCCRCEVMSIPILGRVAAGEPLLAIEDVDSYFPLPAQDLPNKELFMLIVKGNSMINIGILDGDQIIVERSGTAENGDIVVALLDDSVTVKRFFMEDGKYRLQPENDFMEPIITDHVEILGKVTGLYRKHIN